MIKGNKIINVELFMETLKCIQVLLKWKCIFIYLDIYIYIRNMEMEKRNGNG